MNPNMKDMKVDMVPELSRKHFEEALKAARTSVTRTDLEKFEHFRRKFDPSYAARQGGSN